MLETRVKGKETRKQKLMEEIDRTDSVRSETESEDEDFLEDSGSDSELEISRRSSEGTLSIYPSTYAQMCRFALVELRDWDHVGTVLDHAVLQGGIPHFGPYNALIDYLLDELQNADLARRYVKELRVRGFFVMRSYFNKTMLTYALHPAGPQLRSILEMFLEMQDGLEATRVAESTPHTHSQGRGLGREQRSVAPNAETYMIAIFAALRLGGQWGVMGA